MPALIQYLLKLSLAIAVIYLFYYLVLRRLTFYNFNRWYLLGYSLLCFYIPFVNISKVVDRPNYTPAVINYIPTVQNYTSAGAYVKLNATAPMALDFWLIALYILAAGTLILLIRLAVQFISFNRIRRNAIVISDTDAKIYHIDKEITPFSFGNAIYLNKNLHTAAELEEIILHEYVHVKQKHSADILFAELLCAINWYNPFAWLIRHSIRQNLEFIADDSVVRSGLDKKAYQYHLLKVVGMQQYTIANQFNFSSLRKRILMMNKGRSAKINLLRFLFIIPFLAMTLVAFRDKIMPADTKTSYAILFYDLDTYKPIPGISVEEIYGTKTYKTDSNGYVGVPITLSKDKALHVSLLFKKSGYYNTERRFTYPNLKGTVIELIGLRKNLTNKKCSNCFLATTDLSYNTGRELYQDTYAFYQQRINNNNNGFLPKHTAEIIDTVKVTNKLNDTTTATDTNKTKSLYSNVLIKGEATLSSEDSTIRNNIDGAIYLYGNAGYKDDDVDIKADIIKFEGWPWYGWAKALILVNDNEVSFETFKSILGEQLKSVYILKSFASTKAYGKKGSKGVVVVYTNGGIVLNVPQKAPPIKTPDIPVAIARYNFKGSGKIKEIKNGSEQDVHYEGVIKSDSVIWENKHLNFMGIRSIKDKNQDKTYDGVGVIGFEYVNNKVLFVDNKIWNSNKIKTGKKYRVVVLTNAEAIKKYGNIAPNGAIEFTSVNE